MHGPGCPVCVTPLEMIDRAHAIASRPDVIFCSFGDMLRVPGSRGDLLALKAPGQRRADRLLAARRGEHRRGATPDAQVVFFAIGFETTAPANAMAVWLAQRRGADELQRAGLARAGAAGDDGDPAVARQPRAGLPRPGARLHRDGYARVRADRRAATACRSWSPGFEPIDMLEGVLRAVRQLEAAAREVENQYGRARAARGQPASRAADRRRLRGLRPQVARHRHRSRRAATGCATSTASTTPSAASRSTTSTTEESPAVHQRPDPQGPEEAARLPRVRDRRARRSARSARRWSRPRARARPTTPTGARPRRCARR